MQKIILVTVLLSFYCKSFSQTKKLSEISVSQMFAWNNTTIYDTYSGARAKNRTGNAWSYGTNINYAFGLNKNLYAIAGAGYFNQRFGIQRGFDFYEPNVVTALFYLTKYYAYKSINYFGGIGYRKYISSKHAYILPINSEIRVVALYNFYNTFQQKFSHDFGNNFLGNPNPQVRNGNYNYGSSIILKAGILRPVFKKIKVGLDLLFPVYNKWRKDLIFRENTNEYHGTDFSAGASVNLIFNLKN